MSLFNNKRYIEGQYSFMNNVIENFYNNKENIRNIRISMGIYENEFIEKFSNVLMNAGINNLIDEKDTSDDFCDVTLSIVEYLYSCFIKETNLENICKETILGLYHDSLDINKFCVKTFGYNNIGKGNKNSNDFIKSEDFNFHNNAQSKLKEMFQYILNEIATVATSKFGNPDDLDLIMCASYIFSDNIILNLNECKNFDEAAKRIESINICKILKDYSISILPYLIKLNRQYNTSKFSIS